MGISDEVDVVEDKKEEEIAKKLEQGGFFGFFKNLAPYNKPIMNVFVGLVVSCVQGCIFPVFGIFMTRMLFALMQPVKADLRSESDKWCLGMFMCSVGTLMTCFLQKFLFGLIGENITLHIRQSLYAALIKKHIGWFDKRENAPGVLTSVLASDVQTLNGMSTEGLAVICESMFALICGIALGFAFSWKVALVALGCTPFMMLGGFINAKFQAGMTSFDEVAYKDANLMAGDAINNYRTVASFGYDNLIVDKYDSLVSLPLKGALRKAHCIGFWFGFS